MQSTMKIKSNGRGGMSNKENEAPKTPVAPKNDINYDWDDPRLGRTPPEDSYIPKAPQKSPTNKMVPKGEKKIPLALKYIKETTHEIGTLAPKRSAWAQSQFGKFDDPFVSPKAKVPAAPLPVIYGSNVTVDSPDPQSKYHTMKEGDRDNFMMSPEVDSMPANDFAGPSIGATRGQQMPVMYGNGVTVDSPDPCSKFYDRSKDQSVRFDATMRDIREGLADAFGYGNDDVADSPPEKVVSLYGKNVTVTQSKQQQQRGTDIPVLGDDDSPIQKISPKSIANAKLSPEIASELFSQQISPFKPDYHIVRDIMKNDLNSEKINSKVGPGGGVGVGDSRDARRSAKQKTRVLTVKDDIVINSSPNKMVIPRDSAVRSSTGSSSSSSNTITDARPRMIPRPPTCHPTRPALALPAGGIAAAAASATATAMSSTDVTSTATNNSNSGTVLTLMSSAVSSSGSGQPVPRPPSFVRKAVVGLQQIVKTISTTDAPSNVPPAADENSNSNNNISNNSSNSSSNKRSGSPSKGSSSISTSGGESSRKCPAAGKAKRPALSDVTASNSTGISTITTTAPVPGGTTTLGKSGIVRCGGLQALLEGSALLTGTMKSGGVAIPAAVPVPVPETSASAAAASTVFRRGRRLVESNKGVVLSTAVTIAVQPSETQQEGHDLFASTMKLGGSTSSSSSSSSTVKSSSSASFSRSKSASAPRRFCSSDNSDDYSSRPSGLAVAENDSTSSSRNEFDDVLELMNERVLELLEQDPSSLESELEPFALSNRKVRGFDDDFSENESSSLTSGDGSGGSGLRLKKKSKPKKRRGPRPCFDKGLFESVPELLEVHFGVPRWLTVFPVTGGRSRSAMPFKSPARRSGVKSAGGSLSSSASNSTSTKTIFDPLASTRMLLGSSSSSSSATATAAATGIQASSKQPQQSALVEESSSSFSSSVVVASSSVSSSSSGSSIGSSGSDTTSTSEQEGRNTQLTKKELCVAIPILRSEISALSQGRFPLSEIIDADGSGGAPGGFRPYTKRDSYRLWMLKQLWSTKDHVADYSCVEMSENGSEEGENNLNHQSVSASSHQEAAQVVHEVFQAIVKDDIAALKALVYPKLWALHCTDTKGNTPLIVAAQFGTPLTVKLLLRRGAIINAQNKFGNTAMHFAFEFGRENVITYLLRKGASIDALNHSELRCGSRLVDQQQ